MNNKLRIGVDCDEPLADFNVRSCPWHNSVYGTNVAKEDVTTYRMWKVWNCPKEEFNKRVIEFYGSKDFDKITPTKGSIKGTQFFADQGHEMIIITSRFGPAVEKTVPWLDKHFPGKFSKVIFAQNYATDSMHKTKADICEKEKVDVLIEDCLQYAIECQQKGIPVILFDTPWNRERAMKEEGLTELPSGIVRAEGWQEVIALVTLFKEDRDKFMKIRKYKDAPS